jgi:hypothetical protein
MELVFKAIFSMRKGEGNGRLNAGTCRMSSGRYVINTGKCGMSTEQTRMQVQVL